MSLKMDLLDSCALAHRKLDEFDRFLGSFMEAEIEAMEGPPGYALRVNVRPSINSLINTLAEAKEMLEEYRGFDWGHEDDEDEERLTKAGDVMWDAML